MRSEVRYEINFDPSGTAIDRLHSLAFGPGRQATHTWAQRLSQFSVTWVGAFVHDAWLIGFVHVVWDGDEHGFILDTAVDPEYQRRGIGVRLIELATESARSAGCRWLHVDFDGDLRPFYVDRCGFTQSTAAIKNLES